jgi:hydrogenase maturation factor HypF (carbamoyltransferase family)
VPEIDAAISSSTEALSFEFAQHLAHIQHHLEHELAALADSTTAALKKVTDAERDNARRIEELETRLGLRVAGAVDQSMSARIDLLEQRLSERVAAHTAPLKKHVSDTLAAHGKGWWVPFLVLAAAVAAMAALGYRTWRKIEKTHLL